MSRKAAAKNSSRPRHSRLGREIVQGLKLVERHVKGEIELPVPQAYSVKTRSPGEPSTRK
jgi:hypothetical protein